MRSVANAFEPFDGSQYAYSQRADISYKRLTRTIDLTGLSPGDPASLGFRFSYDTEPGWDFVFVEAHVVGSDEWTTLPDLMGHTSDDTGDSCPEGWIELHPFLEHYQTLNDDGTCSAGGTTGAWNAASGRSQGWEPWEVDLWRLRRRAGRGLDLLRQRLGHPGHRRLRRRDRRLDRRGHDLVRGRRRRDGRMAGPRLAAG